MCGGCRYSASSQLCLPLPLKCRQCYQENLVSLTCADNRAELVPLSFCWKVGSLRQEEDQCFACASCCLFSLSPVSLPLKLSLQVILRHSPWPPSRRRL